MRKTIVKCSHGVPLFERGVRCVDCEIGWAHQMLEIHVKGTAMMKLKIAVLEEEKRCKSGETITKDK